MMTELDRNARAILLTVKDILIEQGQKPSFSDTIRYLAQEVGIEPSATHIENEVAKETNKEVETNE